MKLTDNSRWYRSRILPALIIMILTVVTSCKGGGTSAAIPVTPIIIAELNSFSLAPPGFAPSWYNSSGIVEIWNDENGAVISNATVRMNDAYLDYNPSSALYEGYLYVSPGEVVKLTVTINGASYWVSGTQSAAYPVITSPTPGASWSVGNSHTITWSAGAPIGLAIADAGDPGGNLVWPSDNYLREIDLSATSNIIPANSMSLGNRLAIAGITRENIMSDYSTYYIGFYLTGLSYVPFTVIPSPTPTNIVAAPGSGQVSLSWTPVNGALSYNIYWSTTAATASKASGTQIAGVNSPYVHAVANGTPCYYVVTAVTGSGESAASTPIAQAVPGTTLMGGAVQGHPPTLLNTATPLAGVYGSNGHADCVGTAALFHSPEEITTDGTNLYVTDTYNHIIRKIVIINGEVTTLAGTADLNGSDDGIGPAARFNKPHGITTDGTNLYVADSENHTIRKIVISTGEVTTLAGLAGQNGSADGTGSGARFNIPRGITTDGANVYVTDAYNNTIRKIVISSGEVTTLAGSVGPPGLADGMGSAARFNQPSGITTDGTNLYVSDSYNIKIRKIVISTQEVTTLTWSEWFGMPVGITTDGTSLYVRDGIAVRKIVISTGSTASIPSLVFFSGQGITTDGISIYLLEQNHIIKIK